MVGSLLLLFQLTLTKAMTPNLDTLYPYNTVIEYLSEMSALHPDKVSYSNSSTIQTFSINSSSSHKKAKILFVSSIHGGLPLSTSLSLTLINRFLTSKSHEIQTILNTTQLVFIPVANPKAYLLTEELLRNGEELFVIMTGLEGKAWNCSNQYAGIDPDLNFNASFESRGSPCDEVYSGEKAFTSEISKFISDQFSPEAPVLTILFDHEGRDILYPPTASAEKPEEKAFNFYTSQNSSVDISNYGQFSIIETTKPGTLLEYADSLGKLAYVVNIDPPPMANSSNETQVSDYRTEFVFLAIQSLVSGVKFEFLDFIVSEVQEDPSSNSSSEPNETIRIFFEVNSLMFLDCKVELEVLIDFEGNHDYLFVSLTRKESFYYKSNSTNTTLATSSIDENVGFRKTNFTLSGYSLNLFEFVFVKQQDKGKVEFKLEAALRPLNESYYFESALVEFDGDEHDHHDGHDHSNDRRRAAVLGGVLLIVLLVLLGIAGLILFFTRKVRGEVTN